MLDPFHNKIIEELNRLREVLRERYKNKMLQTNLYRSISEVVVSEVDNDAEACLYCLYYDEPWERKLKLDKKKTFAL